MDKDLESQVPLNGSNLEGNINQSESRTPLKTPTKDIEVKYVASGSLNGEPNVQLDHGNGGFSGLTKEELLKYVNDPFWVRMRTLLFILFWVAWLAMFAAAIAIIVMAPRCEAPKPRHWFEEGPIVKVDLPENEKSLSDLAKKMDFINAKAIILPDLTRKAGGSTADFKSISRHFGAFEDFAALIAAASKKSIRVILTLVPNHSSDQHEWFMKSAARVEPFTDYYIWKSTNAPEKLPNNWISDNDTPAWTNHSGRKEFYLHQFASSQPDLNFRNQKVKDEFESIIKFWIAQGVAGFNFDKVQYLLEDSSFENEVAGSTPGAEHTQYDFWNHAKTYNLPETADLLASWRDLVKLNDSSRITVINGEPPIASNMNKTVGDLFRGEPIFTKIEGTLNSNVLNERIKRVLKKRPYTDWPGVDVLPANQYIAQAGPNAVDALNLITLLLPGTPLIQLGDEWGGNADEVGKWLDSGNDTKNAHRDLFLEAVDLRSTQAILHGTANISVVNNGSAIAVTRWKSGSPGYIAVWNSSPINDTVDLSGPPYLPDELITVIASAAGGPAPKDYVPTNRIFLPAGASVLFTFVPAELDS